MEDTGRALEQFLISEERKAYVIAQLATGNREDALDIVQDAMLGLVRKYRRKPPEQWKFLFFRILQSRIRDWYRRQAVRNRWRFWFGFGGDGKDDGGDPFAAVAGPDADDPAVVFCSTESLAVFEAALRRLPFRQRQAFLLRAWQGFSVRETARMLQCSESSVKTHYARAVKRLRVEMEGHDS